MERTSQNKICRHPFCARSLTNAHKEISIIIQPILIFSKLLMKMHGQSINHILEPTYEPIFLTYFLDLQRFILMFILFL